MTSAAECARIVVDRAQPTARDTHAVEPLTIGIPFACAVCRDEQTLRLSNASRGVPLQTRVLGRWPDGSIKWVLLDFQHASSDPREYQLTWSGGSRATPPHKVRTVQSVEQIEVDTGSARFVIRRGGRFPFDAVFVNEAEIAQPETTIEGIRGDVHQVGVAHAAVDEQGDLRVAVTVSADVTLQKGRTLTLSASLHFFAGSETVRVVLTVGNPDRARHRGGFWELGDPSSVCVRDISCSVGHVSRTARAQAGCSSEPGAPLERSSAPMELYQDSSGGEGWSGPIHVNRTGRNPNRFQGYELTDARGTRRGRRATPWMTAWIEDAWVGVTAQAFWQNAPKAIETDGSVLTLRLWPRQYGDVHELQGGEQKTHVFYVSAGRGSSESSMEWCRTPSVARAEPRWYCSTGVNPYLTPAADDPHSTYLALVNSAIDGPDSFEQKRETIDEYGWRHYGDVYADHETAFQTGPELLVSHYNNQYDVLAGFIFHFMRSGDPRWWHQMQALVQHVSDIDVYHTNRDKSAYNGGLFWHTIHYVDAGRSTHRSYPRSTKSNGGGPSSEHNYATGLMLHYFLTGNARSRETAIGLARWVVSMDDGAESPFRWVARGPTGLASATNGVQGPGRGAGNSMCALLDGYSLTGDRTLLDKAEELMRRCVHPSDHIDSGALLDRERCWSYVVFLQALGRYLDEKRAVGELDRMYAYARTCLLTYARWMADHEFPYLDKPEMLEFPNETWAAQDIRKSEVFKFAAMHSAGAERERFLERSRFFFEYSTSALSASPRHGRTRPTVLMLLHGYSEPLFRSDPPSYPVGPTDITFAPPVPFLPQKEIAKRRVATLIAVGGVIAALVAAFLAARLF